jgi:hypothetical protein
MGTSASSKGPGGGVPLVPPWVPPIPPQPAPDGEAAAPEGSDGPDGQNGADGQVPSQNQLAPQEPAQPSALAPAHRFTGARLNFGKFAQGGKQRDLRRALRAYVRKGYSGRTNAVQRFGGTAATANALFGALASVAAGQAVAPGSSLDPALLAGHSAREVMDAIIEAVRPADGTQDAEANRAAIKDALSGLLTLYPDADLLKLTDEQRAVAVERFVAFDVFQRAMLDIGTAIQEKAPSAAVASSRIKEVKDYIKQTVAASFRRLAAKGERLTKGRIAQVVGAALGESFRIFEGYAV